MDNPTQETPNFRFIGIDLGNSSTRMSKTVRIPESEEFENPEVRMFETNTYFPSLVVFKPDRAQTITKRGDLQKLVQQNDEIQSIETNFVHTFGSVPGDDKAGKCIKAITDRLFQEARAWFRFNGEMPEDFQVTLGVPSDWNSNDEKIQALKKLVNQSGFTNVQIIPDAVAAVNYHLFNRELTYHFDQSQSWLVIDVGGISTRITCVEKLAGSTELRVKGSFRVEWGGDQIDDRLYENLFLANHGSAIGFTSVVQKVFFRQMMCELKEKLSAKLNRGDHSEAEQQITGIQEAVELSDTAFETSTLCASLIQQFQNLINDPRLESDPAFQDFSNVILVGGGANWYFVQEAVKTIWPEHIVVAKEPHLTVVRGLAVARTGFEPLESEENPSPDVTKDKSLEESKVQILEPHFPTILASVNTNGRLGPGKKYPIIGHLPQGKVITVRGKNEDSSWWYIEDPAKPERCFWVTSETTLISGDTSGLRVVSEPSPADTIKLSSKERHDKSSRLILWCAIAGAGIALLVSPIPGASWPFLMALEIFMVLRIATSFYGYKITSSTVILLVVGLLVVSTILTLVVGEVLGTLAWAVGLGWLLKMVVAGLVVWGLGKGAVAVLDKIAASNDNSKP